MGLIPRKPEGEAAAAWPSILIGMFVAFGGILYGYDTGLISGIQEMPYWKAEFAKPGESEPTAGEDSLIVSILSLGTFLGALAAGPVADRLGRKWGLIVSTGIVFNFGVILMTAATAQELFIAGRFFAGLGVGLVSAQVPMYQSEVLPKWIRGAVVGCYQWAITIGLLIAACVNYGTTNLDNSGSYRIPVAIQFLWSLILMTGMFFLPETPRYLIRSDNVEGAVASLVVLRRLPADHPALRAEISEVQAAYAFERSLGKASYKECYSGTILKRTLTGIGIQALQQLTGVNFIFYYGVQYFQRAGFTNGFLIQVITNVVNVVSTVPGLWAVDKLGRRTVLLSGALGMAICQYIVAIVGTTVADQGVNTGNINAAAQNAGIAFVCIYIFFFASTWGPGAWVVTGELFPLKVRAKCLSMTTASNWLLNFAIAYSTPYLVDADEANLQSKVFFIWGTACWVCVAFVWFFIYETKNLTLEEVDVMYGEVSKAWRSPGWKPMSAVERGELADEKRASVAEHIERKDAKVFEEEKL